MAELFRGTVSKDMQNKSASFVFDKKQSFFSLARPSRMGPRVR